MNEPQPRARVLVVDDEPDLIRILQFGLQAIGGQGRARQLQKGSVRSIRPVVNSDRDALLADAALATDEHGRRNGGQPHDDLFDRAHLLAVPENVFAAACRIWTDDQRATGAHQIVV